MTDDVTYDYNLLCNSTYITLNNMYVKYVLCPSFRAWDGTEEVCPVPW